MMLKWNMVIIMIECHISCEFLVFIVWKDYYGYSCEQWQGGFG